ncbi:MAG: ribosome small subunit-dependent GTPase A [Firmicutes bacterium]|nr:ribosome small subunit-dependent GTPase A [Bacillota bacterium]
MNITAEITSVSKKGFHANTGTIKKPQIHFCITNNSFVSDELPVVGDIVTLEQRDDKYIIIEVQSRKNFLGRFDHAKQKYQGFAANLDTIFVVTAANKEFSQNRIRRFLLLSGGQDIRKVIVLTKIDQLKAKELVKFKNVLQKEFPMVEHTYINALDKDQVLTLLNHVKKKGSMILLGSSGVGKSTITNTLCDLDLKTKETIQGGRFADKGKHTTSSRNMYYTKSSHKIIDIPGIKIVGLERETILQSEIFSSITTLAAKCKFTNCAHQTEPGCAIKNAIENGTLSRAELDAYLQVMNE